jgi:hypothetical protein
MDNVGGMILSYGLGVLLGNLLIAAVLWIKGDI